MTTEREQDQAGTFFSHTHSDAGGRFAAVGAATVVGANQVTNYPAAAAHHSDPCGPEPELGYRIDAMPELDPGPVSPAQAGAPVSEAPSSEPLGGDVERGAGARLSRTYGRLR